MSIVGDEEAQVGGAGLGAVYRHAQIALAVVEAVAASA